MYVGDAFASATGSSMSQDAKLRKLKSFTPRVLALTITSSGGVKDVYRIKHLNTDAIGRVSSLLPGLDIGSQSANVPSTSI